MIPSTLGFLLCLTAQVNCLQSLQDPSVLMPSESPDEIQGSTRSKRVKRDSKKDYLDDCGYYYFLETRKSFKISSPNFGSGNNYFPNIKCAWFFIGTETCLPEIKCPTLDLRPNDCVDSLTVTDGIGGQLSLCGDNSLSGGRRASQNARDLFVTFVSGQKSTFDKAYQGFSCTVMCAENPGNVKSIPVAGGVETQEDKCHCGAKEDKGRVVGGVEANKFEFPWQVAIVKPGTRQPFCGGTVINSRFILTAAHCFYFTKKKAEEVEVLIHSHQMDFTLKENFGNDVVKNKGRAKEFADDMDKKEKSFRFQVSRIYIHPLFTEQYDFDACLLRLKEPIDFSKQRTVVPICLPKPGHYENTYAGASLTVSGWGLNNESSTSTTGTLQKLDLPGISPKDCRRIMPYDITDRMLCAGYESNEGKDACMGDSGGPLMYRDEDKKRFEQVGIVSWGEGCARVSRPGVYSRVTEFLQWIHHRANLPGTKWCRNS